MELHYFNNQALAQLKADSHKAGVEQALGALREAGYIRPETRELGTALDDLYRFMAELFDDARRDAMKFSVANNVQRFPMLEDSSQDEDAGMA